MYLLIDLRTKKKQRSNLQVSGVGLAELEVPLAHLEDDVGEVGGVEVGGSGGLMAVEEEGAPHGRQVVDAQVCCADVAADQMDVEDGQVVADDEQVFEGAHAFWVELDLNVDLFVWAQNKDE